MTKILKISLALAWMAGGSLAALGIGYIPGALGMVDDYKWGRILGNTIAPMAIGFMVSGILFATGKRRPAYAIGALILAAFVLLDVVAFWTRAQSTKAQ